jgi:ribonucleoside-triphosphate reductase (formate)
MIQLTDDQITAHCNQVDHYTDAHNAADGAKIDPNANVDHKTIATLRAEVHKSEDIQINRRLLQEQLVETFGSSAGKRLAKQYIRDIEDRYIYCHDESALVTPYTFGSQELIQAEYNGKSLFCSFEHLYALCDSTEESLDEDNEVWAKYPVNMQIKDKNGWTGVSRLVRKKRHRPLVRVKTAFGEDIIVTDNHPMIVSDDHNATIDAVSCAGEVQFRDDNVLTFKGQQSVDMAEASPYKVEGFKNHYLSKSGEYGTFEAFPNKVELSEKLGYVVGFFIGGGNYRMADCGDYANTLSFTQKDKSVLVDIADMLYELVHATSYLTFKNDKNNCWCLTVRSRDLVYLFRNVFHIEHYANNKNLPVHLLDYNEEFALGLLAGLLDSDGTVQPGRGSLRLASREAILQVTKLLHHFKFSGGNTIQNTPFGNNTSFKTNYTIWGVNFNRSAESPVLSMSSKFTELAVPKTKFKYTTGWGNITDVCEVGSGSFLNSNEYIYDITTESSTFMCNGLWVHNCAAVNLNPLLESGTRSLGGPSVAPRHLSSYVGQLINISFNVSAQIAGAVGLPGALVHMDAFARNDYGENYMETNREEISQYLQFFLYTLNEPAGARGYQSIFSNISIFDKEYFDALFGITYYPTMPDIKPNWDSYSKLQEYTLDLIREENTRAVLTFPVKTATVLHDGEKEKDPEFVDMIADDLSKGSLMFIYLSDSVDSLSSCCRLKNSLTEDHKEFMHSLGAGGVATGSLNVITLNLNRIVQDNKHLKSLVDRVVKYQVAHRRLFEKYAGKGMYPLYDAGYLDMDKQFLTIGVNGLVEAAESLGIPVSADGEYRNFVTKMLGIISDCNRDAKEEYGYKFNLEFVPAENLGVKNAKWDKEDGYRSPRACYNSYLFPVEDPKLSIIDKFRLHGRGIVDKFDGGQALHLNLEETPTKEGYKALIRLAIRTGCEYFTTNILRTCCEDCGHVEFSKESECKQCGSDNISYATRIIGYLKKIPAFSSERQKEAGIRSYTATGGDETVFEERSD